MTSGEMIRTGYREAKAPRPIHNKGGDTISVSLVDLDQWSGLPVVPDDGDVTISGWLPAENDPRIQTISAFEDRVTYD